MEDYEQTDGALKERNAFQVKKPHKYAIIMLNDDCTPMDFVVHL